MALIDRRSGFPDLVELEISSFTPVGGAPGTTRPTRWLRVGLVVPGQPFRRLSNRWIGENFLGLVSCLTRTKAGTLPERPQKYLEKHP